MTSLSKDLGFIDEPDHSKTLLYPPTYGRFEEIAAHRLAHAIMSFGASTVERVSASSKSSPRCHSCSGFDSQTCAKITTNRERMQKISETSASFPVEYDFSLLVRGKSFEHTGRNSQMDLIFTHRLNPVSRDELPVLEEQSL